MEKTYFSLLLPVYNEEAILTHNLGLIYNYLKTLEKKYQWEIVLVNDGSKDSTGKLIEDFKSTHQNVITIHHDVNLNLGNALKTGFIHCTGEFIVVLDLDLSYSPDHIEALMATIQATRADVVIASPYMKGGKVTAIPYVRKVLSKWANSFMRIAAQEKFHTYTSMVRAYKTNFIKNLNLKTTDYEISPEILYKAMILRARIIEIPAHLDWTEQNKYKGKRTSSIRLLRNFFSSLMAAFIFRPYMYFISVGLILLLISIYLITWIFIHTFSVYPEIILNETQFIDDQFSAAVARVFNERPHSFFVGGFTLLAAVQFLSLGFLSLQNKRYFEESFHISSSILSMHNDK